MFSNSLLSQRKRQIENLSTNLINKRIKALIDNEECELTVIKVIDMDTFHHLSSELRLHCKKRLSDESVIVIELWLFIYAGKSKLFQPHMSKSFDVLVGNELIQLTQ